MTHYVWHDGAWHPTARFNAPSRAPAIISDHMAALKHPCTGQIFDSKSQFRAVTRANGCRELGNDAPIAPKKLEIDRKALREDIFRSISELEQGRTAPLPLSADPASPVRTYK